MDKEVYINKLNKWAEKYVNGWKETTDSIVFRTEDIECRTTMGYYYNVIIVDSINGDRRIHYIVLDTKLMTFPNFLIESVLWHEFCHLWVRFECGLVIESHGKEFKNRQKTVLRYWLGDYIAKFFWGCF